MVLREGIKQFMITAYFSKSPRVPVTGSLRLAQIFKGPVR